jgi:surface-anchored protein
VFVRNPIRALIVTGALVGTLVATAAPAQAQGQVVISQGHVDVVGVAYEDGALDLHIHADGADAEYEPHEVKLQVLPGARTTVPADPAYAFLGDAGDPVWILPQTENPDLVWAGFGAEEIEPGVFQGDSVTITFQFLLAPGELAIYTEDAFGLPADILVDTGDGLPDSVTLPAGDHLHANWAFDAPGHYLLLVKATGTLVGGQTVSDTGVYHFQVRR